MLSVKQGGIEYRFLSLLYDSTRDWTLVSQAVGKHSNYRANILEDFGIFSTTPLMCDILVGVILFVYLFLLSFFLLFCVYAHARECVLSNLC